MSKLLPFLAVLALAGCGSQPASPPEPSRTSPSIDVAVPKSVACDNKLTWDGVNIGGTSARRIFNVEFGEVADSTVGSIAVSVPGQYVITYSSMTPTDVVDTTHRLPEMVSYIYKSKPATLVVCATADPSN